MDYNFVDTVGIWWHGKWQRWLFEADKWVPFVHPEREGNKAPSWWRDYYPPWYWTHYLDDNDRPTETWLELYQYASERLFKTWLNRFKDTAVSDSLYWVRTWTGGPRHGYSTLADWLEALWTYTTSTLRDWINNLAADVVAVYDRLRDWAQARYDAAKVVAWAAWSWVGVTGSLLSAFYEDTHTWIANFIQNPAGVILGVLGSMWGRLVQFDNGPLAYFYNLWGAFRQTLSDFLADPLGYIYDRAEDYLVGKW